MLAVSAQSTGALDYSSITKEDSKSLAKEALVFRRIEQNLQVQYKMAKVGYGLLINSSQKDIIYEQTIAHEQDTYLSYLMPWIYAGKQSYKAAHPETMTAVERFLQSSNKGSGNAS